MNNLATVFVVDVSGSMRGDKFERTKRRLKLMWPGFDKIGLLTYSDVFEWIDSLEKIPNPGGSTDLAGALREVAKAFPSQVIVISDGMPNDPDDALKALDDIPGTVAAIYIGDEDAEDAKAFMQKLGRLGGGGYKYRDIMRAGELESAVKEVLALPPPIAL